MHVAKKIYLIHMYITLVMCVYLTDGQMLMNPATGLSSLLTSNMHVEANASVPPLQFPVIINSKNTKYVHTYVHI